MKGRKYARLIVFVLIAFLVIFVMCFLVTFKFRIYFIFFIFTKNKTDKFIYFNVVSLSLLFFGVFYLMIRESLPPPLNKYVSE